jgi:hypothetical protein
MDLSRAALRRAGWLRSWLGTDKGLTSFLGLIVVLIGIVSWQSIQSARQAADAALGQLADQLAQDIGHDIGQFKLALDAIVTGDHSPASAGLTRQQRDALLSQRATRDRYIDFVEILDSRGDVIASQNPHPESHNWATADYFVGHRDHPNEEFFVGKPYRNYDENAVGFTLSRRIAGPDGQFQGVIVMGISIVSWLDRVSRHEIGPEMEVMMLRGDGMLMAQFPFALKGIGQPMEQPAAFYTFVRSRRSPVTVRDSRDHIERRYVFHEVETLPLFVSLSTPTNSVDPGPVPSWFVPLAAVFGAAAVVMARRLRWRRSGRRSGRT